MTAFGSPTTLFEEDDGVLLDCCYYYYCYYLERILSFREVLFEVVVAEGVYE